MECYDRYSFSHTADKEYTDGTYTHMHNGYEMLYYVRGDAEYIIEGSVYQLRPGTLLFIRPRAFHNLSPLSPTDYERFVIGFPESKIPDQLRSFAEVAREIYEIPKGSFIDTFFSEWAEAERVCTEAELNILLDSAVERLLLHLKYLPERTRPKPIRMNGVLEGVLKYIDEHLSEKLTAETLAARFFVSSSWITHTVKDELGISLMQYIGKKRILYAEALIENGISPSDAAKACGYDTYTTFYRQYKKHTGRSPAEKRSRQGEEKTRR